MNKRRKVSILYFLEQSVKGLWRNGVMTFASIAVLMSCLVVLGSFVLLLYNVNYNINNIGMLNYVLVFVDTDKKPETAAASDQTDGASGIVENNTGDAGQTSGSLRGLWDGLDDDAVLSMAGGRIGDDLTLILNEVEAGVSELRNFTDLSKARVEVDALRNVFAVAKARSGEFAGDDVARYATIEENLDSEYKRITALADIEMEIQKLDNVAELTFTSKAQALNEMNEKYSEYSDLFDRMPDGDNPLADQFTITYEENNDVSTLRYNLEHISDLITRVECREDLANTIENVRSGVIFVFVWFLIVLIVVSMFVSINTIKLAVFSRRQEIAVMRYVGATKAFITTPFVFEGVLIGLISSIIAYVIQYYAYMFIHKEIIADFGFISVIDFSEVGGLVAFGFIAIGIIAGIIGSVISLHKYLKA